MPVGRAPRGHGDRGVDRRRGLTPPRSRSTPRTPARQEAAEIILAEYGRIDILVNCAGIALDMPFLEMDDASRDRVLRVNFLGTFNCCRAVLPAMLAQKYGQGRQHLVGDGPGDGRRRSHSLRGVQRRGLGADEVARRRDGSARDHRERRPARRGGDANAGGLLREMGMDPDEVSGRWPRASRSGGSGQPEDIAGVCLMLVSEYTRYVSGRRAHRRRRDVPAGVERLTPARRGRTGGARMDAVCCSRTRRGPRWTAVRA